MNLCALDRPLENRPDVLDPVRVDDAADVLTAVVVDLLDSEIIFQPDVGLVGIGEQGGASLDPFVDMLLNRVRVGASDDLGYDGQSRGCGHLARLSCPFRQYR